MAALALLAPLAAVALCGALVRDGLLTTSGTSRGRRARGAAGRTEAARPRHPREGSRAAARDRNFLVTTLVVPVILFGFQVILNPGLIQGVTGDYRHAARWRSGSAPTS
jgi:hypothetical protein